MLIFLRSLWKPQGPEPPVMEALEITWRDYAFSPRSLWKPQGPEPPVIEALEITGHDNAFSRGPFGASWTGAPGD